MKKNKNNHNQTANDEIADESKNIDKNPDNAEPDGNKTAFYCAIVALAISAITFILAFMPFPFSGGVYFLIASALCSLACASFLNVQKRHGVLNGCKAVRICAYVLFAAVILVFVGAAIYAGIK